MKKIRSYIASVVFASMLVIQPMLQIAYGFNSNAEIGNKILSKDLDLNSNNKVNIIVQLNSEPLLGKEQVRYSAHSNLYKEQEVFKKRLNQYSKSISKGQEIHINHEYKNIINGFAVTLPAKKVDEIMEFPEVKRIWVDRTLSIGDVKSNNENTSGDNNFLEDTIAELHKNGVNGYGVKVGILDTGIDYNHPDLINHFKGREYIGYDFINGDNDPMEATVQEWKSSKKDEYVNDSTYYTSHGTHVAGILAGKGENKVGHAVTGVAPESEIYSYRVLGPYGQGPTSAIISAVERSIEDGLDIINLSLSSHGGDPIDPLSIALNNAALAGVTPIVAAGNSGTRPDLERVMYSVGTPSAAALPITVGAGTFNTVENLMGINIDNKNIRAKLCATDFKDSHKLLQQKSFHIVSNSFGSKWDYEEVNSEGKISLVISGAVSTEEIIANAKNAGAVAVILYDKSGDIKEYVGKVHSMIPIFTVSMEDGIFLNSTIVNEKNLLKFTDESTMTIKGGELANFSSKGPVFNTFDIKPDIVARGVNIFSTYPEFITHMEDGIDYSTAYKSQSGTSMAAPYVSGVASLILQKNKEYNPWDVKVAIMNTADKMNGEYSVFEVGSGMINSSKAINCEVLFKVQDETRNDIMNIDDKINHTTGSIRFGNIIEERCGEISKELTIQNKFKIYKTYEIGYEFLPEGPGSQWIGTVDGHKNNVLFDLPKSIAIKSNSSEQLNIKPIIPLNAEEGVYEGYISFTNIDDKEDMARIPFAMRYTTKDIEYKLDKNAFTTKLDGLNSARFLQYTMTLNKEVKYIDVFLMDELGEHPLGYFYRIDNPKGFPIGMSFNGAVVPTECLKLTGDKENPISKETFVIKEGKYKIGVAYEDKEGIVKVIKEDLVIDNSKPIITTDTKDGINILNKDSFTVETYMGQDLEAYWIKGKIHDKLISELNKMGYDKLNQTNTKIGLYSNNVLVKEAEIKENGDFKIPVTRGELETSAKFVLIGNGYSGAEVRVLNNIVLINESDTRFVGTFEQEKINKNQITKLNISMENNNDIKEIVITPAFEDMKLKDIQVSEQLKTYAKSNNLKVDMEERGDYFKEFVITLLDKNNEPCVINVENIATMSIEINSSDIYSHFNVEVQATDNTGNIIKKPLLINKYPQVIFNTFDLRMDIFLGALNRCGIVQYTEDKKKTEVYVTDTDGKNHYPDEVNHTTHIFRDLPIMEKGRLVINAPGHLNIDQDISLLDIDENGCLDVKNVDTIIELVGGDTNNDGVIDILDALSIKNNMGKTDEGMEEDLDGNGIINGYDLAMVTRNYLETSIGNTIEPQQIINGLKLENLLNEAQKIGIFMGVDPHKSEYEKGEEVSLKFSLYNIYVEATSVTQEVIIGEYDKDGKLVEGQTVHVQANEGPGSMIINITPTEKTKTIKYFMINKEHNACVIEPTVVITILD